MGCPLSPSHIASRLVLLSPSHIASRLVLVQLEYKSRGLRFMHVPTLGSEGKHLPLPVHGTTGGLGASAMSMDPFDMSSSDGESDFNLDALTPGTMSPDGGMSPLGGMSPVMATTPTEELEDSSRTKKVSFQHFFVSRVDVAGLSPKASNEDRLHDSTPWTTFAQPIVVQSNTVSFPNETETDAASSTPPPADIKVTAASPPRTNVQVPQVPSPLVRVFAPTFPSRLAFVMYPCYVGIAHTSVNQLVVVGSGSSTKTRIAPIDPPVNTDIRGKITLFRRT